MTDLSLIRYRPDRRAEWDRVVKCSKNGNFLHYRDYMDYHAHRFNEQSLVVTIKGEAVAVFPCNRVHDRIISHEGLSYGGLIYRSSLRMGDVLGIFEALAEHYRSEGCSALLYKAVPHIFHRYPADEDLYALFRMGAMLVRRDISSAVRIDRRMELSTLRRRAIRKAVRNRLEIREGRFFDEYHALLSQVLERVGRKPVHSLEELQLLSGRFAEAIRLFGAFRSGCLIAGTVVYDFGDAVHTQYLASSEDGRETGALDYVIGHLLDEVFADRRYFSFGISTEQDGHHLNEGLIFQKEGFGARGVVHDHYEVRL